MLDSTLHFLRSYDESLKFLVPVPVTSVRKSCRLSRESLTRESDAVNTHSIYRSQRWYAVVRGLKGGGGRRMQGNREKKMRRRRRSAVAVVVRGRRAGGKSRGSQRRRQEFCK